MRTRASAKLLTFVPTLKRNWLMNTLTKTLTLLWLAGMSGCASVPAAYRAPDIALDRPAEQAPAEPLPLPEWPIPEVRDVDGQRVAIYTAADLQALDRHLVACEANTDIAATHAEALALRKDQLNATITACEALRQHDQLVGEALQRALEAHQRDLWLYRATSSLLLILLVL